MLNLSFEMVLPWEAPAGKWRLLYFLQKEVPYYIDTLNPESTERFIEPTHERYRQSVGKDFGTTVPGFYTDEPAMHYYHVGIDNYVVPWTSQMFKIFRERPRIRSSTISSRALPEHGPPRHQRAGGR